MKFTLKVKVGEKRGMAGVEQKNGTNLYRNFPPHIISIACSLGPQALVIHIPPHTLMLLPVLCFGHILYAGAG